MPMPAGHCFATFPTLLALVLTLVVCSSCSSSRPPQPLDLLHAQADETRDWFAHNPPDGKNVAQRRAHMAAIQTYADALPPEVYAAYMDAAAKDPAHADRLEEHPVLYYLARATDQAFADIRSTRVTHGLALWHIYNMGYVFKTPTSCFAIDLKARDAARLADSLDFLLITHQHADHNSPDLIDAMIAKGKPVITSFDPRTQLIALPGEPTPAAATRPISQERTTLHFKDITIKIDIGDHHKNPGQLDNMLMYQVDCGPASGDFTLYHSGDGCNPAKMKPDRPVDLFILHIAVGMKPADAITHIQPKLTLASHVLELGHSTKPPHPWRWSFDYAYGTIDYLPQSQATILTWGERYLTPGTQIQAIPMARH